MRCGVRCRTLRSNPSVTAACSRPSNACAAPLPFHFSGMRGVSWPGVQ